MIFLFLVLSGDDEELLKMIYETQNIKMYNIAFKILNKHEDAEEAVQEAFMRMTDKIERIKELPSPDRVPFCVVIVKNVSKNLLRDRKLHQDYDEIKYMVADETSDPLDGIDLSYALNTLSKGDKEAILLKWGKGMSHKEMGEVLGVGEETAAKRGQRALNRLRSIYMEGHSNEK